PTPDHRPGQGAGGLARSSRGGEGGARVGRRGRGAAEGEAKGDAVRASVPDPRPPPAVPQ
ncbi:unnamed protein product, partial [Prorocentrum cordatum]